ncbi:MAG: hypothetical protein BroJett011_40060 [Chloroflexota bacterium]|nr:MAG: hypothetical protein BroJett011_40060 [Chloroflexota bacterium]
MSQILKSRRIEFDELTRLLGEYERKYNFSTIEFFQRYLAGELGDDDDLMMWAGLYHLYLTSHPVRKFMREDTPLAT